MKLLILGADSWKYVPQGATEVLFAPLDDLDALDWADGVLVVWDGQGEGIQAIIERAQQLGKSIGIVNPERMN